MILIIFCLKEKINQFTKHEIFGKRMSSIQEIINICKYGNGPLKKKIHP